MSPAVHGFVLRFEVKSCAVDWRPRRGKGSVAPALGLALLFGLSLWFAAPAEAQITIRPRVAVAVEADDSFIQVYLSEILARVLRANAFEVVPPVLTLHHLERLGGGTGCVDRDPCIRSLAHDVAAPTLILVEARSLDDGFALRVRVAVVSLQRIVRAPPVDATGTEAETAEQILATATEVAQRVPPCQITVDASMDIDVQVGDQTVSDFPLFLDSGAHELTIRADGRQPATVAMECDGGHRYRLRVR
ncbi:MAG: hypothetical protein AAGF12_25800 [Myxococcota bacterium]